MLTPKILDSFEELLNVESNTDTFIYNYITGRKLGKNKNIEMILAYLTATRPNTAVYGIRKMSSDLPDTMNEGIQNALDLLKVKHTHSIGNRKWKLPNGSFFKTKGIFSGNSKKIAISGLDVPMNITLCFVWIDEIVELTEREVSLIHQAFRLEP